MGLYHTSGTVKMGLPSNRSSCVDRDLKVHGLESLRVADMSVTPMLPRLVSAVSVSAYFVMKVADISVSGRKSYSILCCCPDYNSFRL